MILESGFAADASAWYKVQPMLAKTMRVCAYDRAGASGSDPGPFPRDGDAIAKDLDQALTAAKSSGPFIGVGHSAGGLYIRLFAARRVGQMKGLVLVDPSIEHQVSRAEARYGPGAGSVEGIRRNALACAVLVEKKPLNTADPNYARCVPGPDKPQDRADALKSSKWRTQLSEIDTLFTSTSDQVDRDAAKVRKVPTIILTATPTASPPPTPATSPSGASMPS